MKKFLLIGAMLFVMSSIGASASAASSSTMSTYLDRYCDDLRPVDCGRYDDDIEDAQDKAEKFAYMLDRYDSVKQNMIRQYLKKGLANIFDESTRVEDKLIAAYYYDYFTNSSSSYDVDDVFSQLFDRRVVERYVDEDDYDYYPNSTRYSSRYDDDEYYYASSSRGSDDAELTSVRGANSRTSVSSSTIRLRDSVLDLQVKAEDEDGDAIRSTSHYRVVAKTDRNRDRTYAASYESNGTWRLRLANTFRSNDDITIYLLCKSCSSGARFSSDSILDGWRIVDSNTYDVSTSSSSRYDDDYYYDNDDDDYDLAITDVEYEYDINSRDTEVRLTTLVSNEGRRDMTLSRLDYDIEVDGDRLSSRDYDIDHVRTDCDDSNVSSSRETNISIDRNDECEITVDIFFDTDDVEDETMNIEVSLEASRDGNSRNDDDEVRFRVD